MEYREQESGMTDDEKAIFTKAVFAMNDELKRKEPDWAWLAQIAGGIGLLSKPAQGEGSAA